MLPDELTRVISTGRCSIQFLRGAANIERFLHSQPASFPHLQREEKVRRKVKPTPLPPGFIQEAGIESWMGSSG